VKAGLDRVRAQGVELGRRRVVVNSSKIVEMKTQGMSLREIAETIGVSAMTVQRLLRTSPF
jgi:DNA invertase Pin-like site-specific DNA recombinase